MRLNESVITKTLYYLLKKNPELKEIVDTIPEEDYKYDVVFGSLDSSVKLSDNTLIYRDKHGKALGFCQLADTDKGLNIGICVRKDYWSKGISNILVEDAIKWAKKHGYFKLRWRCHTSNKRSLNLALKNGFKIIKSSSDSTELELLLVSKGTIKAILGTLDYRIKNIVLRLVKMHSKNSEQILNTLINKEQDIKNFYGITHGGRIIQVIAKMYSKKYSRQDLLSMYSHVMDTSSKNVFMIQLLSYISGIMLILLSIPLYFPSLLFGSTYSSLDVFTHGLKWFSIAMIMIMFIFPFVFHCILVPFIEEYAKYLRIKYGSITKFIQIFNTAETTEQCRIAEFDVKSVSYKLDTDKMIKRFQVDVMHAITSYIQKKNIKNDKFKSYILAVAIHGTFNLCAIIDQKICPKFDITKKFSKKLIDTYGYLLDEYMNDIDNEQN